MSKDVRHITERCKELEKKEKDTSLASTDTIRSYAYNIKADAKKLKELVQKLHKEGNRIVGYGAAAKGFSVLKLANITNEIECFVDDSPAKQGKFTPVTHIPIKKRSEVKDPDYFFITAPNYKSAIIEKEKKFKGKFITVDAEIIDGKHTLDRSSG